MKWGVRRYQKPGSSKRTPEGKIRYAHSGNVSFKSTKVFGSDKSVQILYATPNKNGKRSKVERHLVSKIGRATFPKELRYLRDLVKPKNALVYTSKQNPFGEKTSGFVVMCSYRHDPSTGVIIDYDEEGNYKKHINNARFA
jgi:hypothetical protein